MTTMTNATAASTSSKLRSVRKILPRPAAHWVGDGFHVYPVFGNLAFTEAISPLLMFDYAAPRHFPARHPGQPPLGVGQHPHRGFETVTIAFQGEVEHHDSTGKTGIIQPGDVQWMTAGRGIIHQEYQSNDFTAQGGTLEMLQLWVNLPKKYKMTKPGYQAILNKDIPVVGLPLLSQKNYSGDGSSNDNKSSNNTSTMGTARIIAGQLGETKGSAKTFSPVQMWDVSLPQAGSKLDLPFPAHHNCLVFVRRGVVEIVSSSGSTEESTCVSSSSSNHRVGPQDVALMELDGTSDTLRLHVLEPDSSLVIFGGEPLHEPIAAHGPFVMNTRNEINQAISDYRFGKFSK